jgi:hypothetical protein
MARLGYTFYPKDWRSSMNVSQLNLQERGFYRELIDECFIQNSFKIKINCKSFTRIHQLNSRSFARLLAKLHESLLIVCPNFDQTLPEVEILIPSVSHRLVVIKDASNGGKGKALNTQKSSAKENIKEKEKEKGNIIPTLFEFLDFCKTIEGINFSQYEYSLKSKYEAWVDNSWMDGNDKKIKNWKSKIKNTIPFLKPVQIKTTGGMVR